jgi:hypothetical protein
MHRQDNRISGKQIIVIAQNPLQQTDWYSSQAQHEIKVHTRTQMLLDFFTGRLGFKQHEIVYFTETEVRSLVKLLDQS